MSASDTDAPHTPTTRGAKHAADSATNGASADSAAETPATTTSAPPSSAGAPQRRPTIEDIWQASDVIHAHIHHTPLLSSHTLGRMTDATVFLKAENLQRSGSYKVRGATYKLSRLTEEERAHGVIAASAGNHAQGVAIAASALGIACTIVMPATAPLAKIAATEGFGAEVILYGQGFGEAYARAREIEAETGATFIHPFDDPDIIAGQGTVGLEIFSDMPDVEAIVVSIGGGGLISGIATALKKLNPDVRIYGVEAAGAAPMLRSIDAGRLVTLDEASTIADGIAVKQCGELTYAITRDLVDEVVTVEEDEIIRAVLLLMERCKLVVEGAGAAGVAALIAGKLPIKGKRTAVVLSGGNIDMTMVGRIIAHGLSIQGRYLSLRVLVPDRPGQLLKLLNVVAEQGVNVLDVSHHRAAPRAPIQQVEVSLVLETRDREHCDFLIGLLRERGFAVKEENHVFDR